MAQPNNSLLLSSFERVRKELSTRKIPLVVAETFILASISLASLLGNLLILLAFFKSPRLKNPTNYLIISLALSDLLTALIVVPMSTGVLATGEMFMGVMGCKVFGCLAYLLSNITVYTVCLIAFNRLLLAVRPRWYDFFFSAKSTIMTVVSSWVFQLVYAFLPAVANWSEVFLLPGYTTCALFVTNPVAKLIYRTQSELQVVGGLVIIIVCYAVVFIKFKKSKSVFPENHNDGIIDGHPSVAAVDHVRSSLNRTTGANASKRLGEANLGLTLTTICEDKREHTEEQSAGKESDELDHSSHTTREPLALKTTSTNEPNNGDIENDHHPRRTSNKQTQDLGPETDGYSPRVDTHETNTVTVEGDPQNPHRFLSKLKTTKLLFAITLCFLVSWIPLTAMVVVESYQSKYASRQVELFGITLFYLGTTLNPIILPIMSRHFRAEFLKVLCTKNTPAVGSAEQ